MVRGKTAKAATASKATSRALAPARQLEEPQAASAVARADSDSPGFLQAQAGRSLQDDDARLVDRRLDEEVVGKRRGVELRPQETRSAIQVARDHRRRDLPTDVVLDDRLAGMHGPDQKRRQQRSASNERESRRPAATSLARSANAAPRERPMFSQRIPHRP